MRYEIQGTPFPVVICELEKGEKMVSDSGTMAWMDPLVKPLEECFQEKQCF